MVYLIVVLFNTEKDRDVLRGLVNDRDGEVFLAWSGKLTPGRTAISPTGSAYMHFYSDSMNHYKGFEVDFMSGRYNTT